MVPLVSVQISSVAQSCPSLCDPMDCSMPGFPVHHELPDLAQAHVHQVSGAIQPFHPLSPLLLLPSIFPSITVFSLHQVAKVLKFQLQHQSFQWKLGLISFRMDWFDPFAVQGTLESLLQHHSSEASIIRHSAFFIVQISHPYMTTGKTRALTIQTFVETWCLCFLIHCLNLSWIFFQGASVLWFHGWSHCLQWLWSPRK